MSNELDGVQPSDKLDNEVVEEPKVLADEELSDKTPEELLELVKTTQKANQTLFHQKTHFKTKYEKASEQPTATPEPQSNKNSSVKKDDDAISQIDTRLSSIEEREAIADFASDNSLSTAQARSVFAFAKATGKQPSEVLDDPFVKGGIEKLAAKDRVDNGTPAPSKSSFGSNTGNKPLSEMNDSEKRDGFEAVKQGIRSGR